MAVSANRLELLQIADAVAREKSIDRTIVITAMEEAIAKAARSRGAEINRQTKVTGIEQKPSGEWLVKTSKGDITAEHVVTASGSWARQIAAMVGLDIPVIAVEHQYIVTEPCADLLKRKEQGLPEMAVLRESDQSYYLREERQGLIVGPYEKGAPAWAVAAGAARGRPGAAASVLPAACSRRCAS